MASRRLKPKSPRPIISSPAFLVLEHRRRLSLRAAVVAAHQRDHPRGLALLVFVPIRYVYPSRTIALKWPTLLLGTMWAALLTWMIWRLPAVDGPWTCSLWYFLSTTSRCRCGFKFRRSSSSSSRSSSTCSASASSFRCCRSTPSRSARRRSTIGLLGTSFSLMQFLFSPIWGRWSDRIGRKPIILVGLLGSCLSYLGLALAARCRCCSSRASSAGLPAPTSRPRRPISPTSRRPRIARAAWAWSARRSASGSSSVPRSAAC